MDSSPMTQGAGNSFLPKIMFRTVFMGVGRAVAGTKAVVNRVLVEAVDRADARRMNECLAMVDGWINDDTKQDCVRARASIETLDFLFKIFG